jgi:hypothetical protein
MIHPMRPLRSRFGIRFAQSSVTSSTAGSDSRSWRRVGRRQNPSCPRSPEARIRPALLLPEISLDGRRIGRAVSPGRPGPDSTPFPSYTTWTCPARRPERGRVERPEPPHRRRRGHAFLVTSRIDRPAKRSAPRQQMSTATATSTPGMPDSRFGRYHRPGGSGWCRMIRSRSIPKPGRCREPPRRGCRRAESRSGPGEPRWPDRTPILGDVRRARDQWGETAASPRAATARRPSDHAAGAPMPGGEAPAGFDGAGQAANPGRGGRIRRYRARRHAPVAT